MITLAMLLDKYHWVQYPMVHDDLLGLEKQLGSYSMDAIYANAQVYFGWSEDRAVMLDFLNHHKVQGNCIAIIIRRGTDRFCTQKKDGKWS